ncbi:MAG: TonB-dependent receptor [Saprospiraceae bacterium]|nr:TonB-dependent receptor [Saprospiraceae bacterium]
MALGSLKVGPFNRLLVTDTYAVERFDMQDEIFTTAFGTENNLSVSGGNDKTNYFASFGYTNNDGIIQNTNFTKYTGRLRLNQTLADWASISAGISYNYSLSQDLPNGNNFFSPISTMFIIDNVWDITERDEGGNLKQVELVRVNPLTVTETFDITQTTNRSIGDVQLNLYPFKGFSVNAILGYDTYSLVGNEFHPRIPYPGVAADFFPDGYVSYATSNVFLLNHDLTANYTKEFGDFTSTTTAGYQIQNSNSQFTSQAGRDLAPFVQTISAAANLFSAPRQSIAERSIWGYFLQQTVGYKDQVFVTLAGRIDGSSVFSTDNQNIFYPKASASWVLTDYFKDSGFSNFLSSAKLRASYGQAGNLTGIGAYDRYNNYLTAQLGGLTAVQPSTVLANPNVRPELMTEFEYGADLAFANNRIGLNITIYNQDIEDLLLTRPLPPTAGGNSIVTNEGSMVNNGLELMLQGSPILTDKVRWNLSLLYSQNRNEVNGIEGVLALRGSGGAQSAINGEQFGVFYGTYYARNAQGNLLLTSQGLAQPERGTQTSILAGTPAFNADGQPSGTELRRIIGDPNPEWYGTLTSDLAIGKFSFRFQFDAIWGFDVYNWNRITGNNVGHGKLAEREIKGELPRGYVASIAGGVTGGRIQEEHIEDGSFVKLRELAIGYDFGKIGNTLSNLNFSIIGRNLLSIDDYEGYDPETNSAGQTDRVRGDDFGNVPIPRMIQFRLGATFNPKIADFQIFKNNIMKKYFYFYAIIPMFLLGSCEQELLNPNAATSEDVLNSVDGLLGMVVGLKRTYSVGATGSIYSTVSANGMTTKELFVINTGNTDLASLEAGAQTLNNNNSFVRNIWANCNIVNTNSQILIDNVDNISDAATANAVLAYAHLFKALAIGTLAQFFEQVPAQTSTSSDFLAGKFATFVPRAQALQEAINLLEAAAALNVTPSGLFNSKVGTDISINNAIQALLARYYNMVGNNDKALEAAGKVDLTSRSIFRYDVLNQNPVFRTSLVNNNTYNGVFNFGLTGELAPDPADGRIVFYLADNPATNVKVQGFFKSDTDAIPF